MQSTVDWNTLVGQGRAKAYGVRWSQEEKDAIASGVPVEYVRKGCLTVEEYQEMKLSSPIKSKSELIDEAKELGSQVSEEAPIEVIEHEIEMAKKKATKRKVVKETTGKTKKADS